MATVDSGVPKGLAHWAIGVGLGLTALGVALIVADKGQPVGNLTTCVGFGIILAAFGSRASGKFQGWSATGAGALGIVLFLVLQNASPGGQSVKRGQIGGDIQKAVDMRIVDESPLYSYRDSTTKSIRFVILEKHFLSPQLTIQVESADGDSFEMVGDGPAIAKRYANTELIKWTYDHAQRVVKDRGAVIFQVPGRLENLPKFSQAAPPRTWSLLPPVFAQEAPASAQDLVAQLYSDNQIVRRNARDDLAALGPTAVRPMMTAWRHSTGNARVKSGVVTALNAMLRQNGALDKPVSRELSNDDIKLLVAAASDEDKTVRVQAAEFLYRLRDSRVVEPSVQAVRQQKSADGVYNSIVILQPVFGQLPDKQQSQIQGELLRAVPAQSTRTRELVQQLKK